MDTAALQSTIRDLLTDGQLEEAIDLLVAESRAMDAKLHREAVALSGRLKELQKKERLGTATTEEVRVERNRLQASVLDLIAQPEGEEGGVGRKNRSLKTTVALGVAGVILLALIAWGIKTYTGGPVDLEVHLVDSESRQRLTDLSGDTLILASGQGVQRALVQNGVAIFEKLDRSVKKSALRFQLSGRTQYALEPGSGPIELTSDPVRLPVVLRDSGKPSDRSGDLNIQIEGDNNQLFNMGDSSTVNQTFNNQ